jgi:hypothetical protein
VEEPFEEARRVVPMPDPPKSLIDATDNGLMQMADVDKPRGDRIDPARFRDIT